MNEVMKFDACAAEPALRGAVPALASGSELLSVVPLRSSLLLRHASTHAAALTRELYACAPLRRTVGDVEWHFRWRHVSGPLGGILLQLRIGGAEVTVGLDDLGPFKVAAADVLRPALPAALCVAYLSGVGALLWRTLEILMREPIEVVGMRRNRAMAVVADCVGFELRHGPEGPAALGFVCADDEKTRRILVEASRREMTRTRPPADLPIQWAAVVGTTMLPAADLRELQPGDTVLIEDAAYSADALGCRLEAGGAHRPAGRASLRQGKLHMVEFAIQGNAGMGNADVNTTNDDAGQAPAREAAFGDIQVAVRFELARWHASLADIGGLAAGAVIDVGQSIDEPAVSVWAERRCIGKGQLVAIGDRLGVRLLSVFGEGAHDGHPQSASAQPAASAAAEITPAEPPAAELAAGERKE